MPLVISQAMGGVLGVGESQSSKPTLWFSTLMRQGYMVVETLQDSVKGAAGEEARVQKKEWVCLSHWPFFGMLKYWTTYCEILCSASDEVSKLSNCVQIIEHF